MCNICFCLFTRSCEETENCGCSCLCLFFFLFLSMTERGACGPKTFVLPYLFFFPLKYYSAASSFFAHALFLCFSVVHLFASSLCFWHRRHRALSKKKKPTETFAFFLFTRSTSALLGDGSQSFVSLSRCLTKLTLHFASCGHEQHCRNTAVWGNGQVLKRRSCCVCG